MGIGFALFFFLISTIYVQKPKIYSSSDPENGLMHGAFPCPPLRSPPSPPPTLGITQRDVSVCIFKAQSARTLTLPQNFPPVYKGPSGICWSHQLQTIAWRHRMEHAYSPQPRAFHETLSMARVSLPSSHLPSLLKKTTDLGTQAAVHRESLSCSD